MRPGEIDHRSRRRTPHRRATPRLRELLHKSAFGRQALASERASFNKYLLALTRAANRFHQSSFKTGYVVHHDPVASPCSKEVAYASALHGLPRSNSSCANPPRLPSPLPLAEAAAPQTGLYDHADRPRMPVFILVQNSFPRRSESDVESVMLTTVAA